MAISYSYDAFAAQIHTTFWLATGSEPLPLELINVSPLRQNPVYESYSLELRGPADSYIPQASYRFEHEAIGAIEIFIVPIRQDQQGLYYEASFNCLRSKVAA